MAMSGDESRLRTALTVYFPMFIATLSLITSIYNGYLNNKFVNVIHANLGRTEYMRSCKEIIDAYFQVKFRTSLIAPKADARPTSPSGLSSEQEVEAANAVTKFAALATYLANLRDEETRARYTALSRQLETITRDAARMPAALPETRFAEADRLFATLNDDCVRSANAEP